MRSGRKENNVRCNCFIHRCWIPFFPVRITTFQFITWEQLYKIYIYQISLYSEWIHKTSMIHLSKLWSSDPKCDFVVLSYRSEIIICTLLAKICCCVFLFLFFCISYYFWGICVSKNTRSTSSFIHYYILYFMPSQNVSLRANHI